MLARWTKQATMWALRVLSISLFLALLALLVISGWFSVRWEGPSDWEVEARSGVLELTIPNWGREHFRGPYGTGWHIESQPRQWEWRDGCSDSGPYSGHNYPICVPLVMMVLFSALTWERSRHVILNAVTPMTVFGGVIQWALTAAAAICIVGTLIEGPSLLTAIGLVLAFPMSCLWRRHIKQIGKAARRADMEAIRASGTCPLCGYSLTGLASNALCPECGKRYPETM